MTQRYREKILTAPQAMDPVFEVEVIFSVMCYINNKFSFTLNKNHYLQVKKKKKILGNKNFHYFVPAL